MSEEKYLVACFTCGGNDGLQMFAHRNDHGEMVGWLFVCTNHAATVSDGKLLVTMKEPQ